MSDDDWDSAPMAKFTSADTSLVSTSTRFGKQVDLHTQSTKESLCRLKSIDLDCEFVRKCGNKLEWMPHCANVRNGSWYFFKTPSAECRFRSSDGHGRTWAFHSSRANIGLAKLAHEKGGVMIVDSTRSGKRFPDSFARTVPLWCCIMNRALGFTHAKIELANWMPGQECNRISERELDLWAQQAKELWGLPLMNVDKPLKSFWIANDDSHWRVPLTYSLEDACMEIEQAAKTCVPIVCVSASSGTISPTKHRELHSWPYLPGGGDDEEHWSKGLTASMFQNPANRLALLSAATTEECNEMISEIVVRGEEVSFTCEADDADSAATAITFSTIPVRGIKVTWGFAAATNPAVDLSWIKGQDKSWWRRHPTVWKTKALPDSVKLFATHLAQIQANNDKTTIPPSDFVIHANDAETALIVTLAIIAVYYDDDLEPHYESCATTAPDKHRLKTLQAKLNARTSNGGMIVSRRLMKELNDYFTNVNWPPV